MAALQEHRGRLGGSPQPDALVFPNKKGGSLDAHNLLWRVLYLACDGAGVPRVSWHALRHTHATLLNVQGESVRTIQAQLRHSSARVALETYTQVVPEQQRSAVERLERLVFGPKFRRLRVGRLR
ncbi:MAG: tyrosine-type recombinase/integrase [Terriglobia bacterium]